jgi:hypothetical protein
MTDQNAARCSLRIAEDMAQQMMAQQMMAQQMMAQQMIVVAVSGRRRRDLPADATAAILSKFCDHGSPPVGVVLTGRRDRSV